MWHCTIFYLVSIGTRTIVLLAVDDTQTAIRTCISVRIPHLDDSAVVAACSTAEGWCRLRVIQGNIKCAAIKPYVST